MKGKEKTFIEREPRRIRPYESEVARFISVPLARRSIGNNYPVCNRRPPLIILGSFVGEELLFLIFFSPWQDKIELSEMGIMRLRWNRIATGQNCFRDQGLPYPV